MATTELTPELERLLVAIKEIKESSGGGPEELEYLPTLADEAMSLAVSFADTIGLGLAVVCWANRNYVYCGGKHKVEPAAR